MLRKLGFVGALLTCPCHAVLVLLLLGGTTAGAWLTANVGLTFGMFTAAFLFFLWLATRPGRSSAADGAACETCAPDDAVPAQGHMTETSHGPVAGTASDEQVERALTQSPLWRRRPLDAR